MSQIISPLTKYMPYETRVQRCNLPSGKEPSYRFKGVVCGNYYNPANGERGHAVSLDADPGCVQIFPLYMLETRE